MEPSGIGVDALDKYAETAKNYLSDEFNKVVQSYDKYREQEEVRIRQLDSLHELYLYSLNNNSIFPCYFNNGEIYGYMYNAKANINVESYDSTLANVKNFALAMEAYRNSAGFYTFSGIDAGGNLSDYVWGSASPAIVASGVVNALGFYVTEGIYENNKSYWGNKLSASDNWKSYSMRNTNYIPILVNLSSKRTYVPSGFVLDCISTIAKESENWGEGIGTKEIDGNEYQYYSFTGSTPWLYAAHGEFYPSQDQYTTTAGTIILNSSGSNISPMIVSKTPLTNVTVTLKYKRADGTIETETATGDVSYHVTGDGYDFYSGSFSPGWWVDSLSHNYVALPLLETFHDASQLDRNRMIEAALTGFIDYTGMPDYYNVIPGAITADMNNWRENYPTDQDIQGYFGRWSDNSIRVSVVDGSSTVTPRESIWYPIAIPYDFAEPIKKSPLPDDFYDTTQTPLPNVNIQIWNGGDSSTYTEEQYKYITENILGPTNYYHNTYILNPDGDTPVEKDDTTGIGETEDVEIDLPETLEGIGAIYRPSSVEVQRFMRWLYNTDEDILSKIKKYFNNPIESVISLHTIPSIAFDLSMTGERSQIMCGYIGATYDNPVSGDHEAIEPYTVVKRYGSVNWGTKYIMEVYGNVFDYAPYTSIKLYLPYLGYVQLPVELVMRSALTITQKFDVLTGAFLYEVFATRDGNKVLVGSYGGNCANQFPISQAVHGNIMGSLMSLATGVATLNPVGVATGLAGAMVSNAQTNVQTSGGFSSQTGIMGKPNPYLLITRTMPNMDSNFNAYIGYPYNMTNYLCNCLGFTQCEEVHLDTSGISEVEKDLIMAELRKGVII